MHSLSFVSTHEYRGLNLGVTLTCIRRRYEADDTLMLLEKNLDEIKGKMRIQISCGTLDDTHLPTNRL